MLGGFKPGLCSWSANVTMVGVCCGTFAHKPVEVVEGRVFSLPPPSRYLYPLISDYLRFKYVPLVGCLWVRGEVRCVQVLASTRECHTPWRGGTLTGSGDM